MSEDSFAARFFLEEDGTFALDFGTTRTSSAEYVGTYTREDMVLDFDFFDGWLATGLLAGDCLTVDFNDAMEFDGFADGEFCRS